MNEIEKKINELIELISNQEAVIRYKEIEKAMSQNEYIKNKIETFKNLQKRIVIYEAKHQDVPKEIIQRYDKLYQELIDIPIYNEYLMLQREINEILQTITAIIEEEINKEV